VALFATLVAPSVFRCTAAFATALALLAGEERLQLRLGHTLEANKVFPDEEAPSATIGTGTSVTAPRRRRATTRKALAYTPWRKLLARPKLALGGAEASLSFPHRPEQLGCVHGIGLRRFPLGLEAPVVVRVLLVFLLPPIRASL
jgi:hypothetical protein